MCVSMVAAFVPSMSGWTGVGSGDIRAHRWTTWESGEDIFLERALEALECLGGVGPTASVHVLLRGRDGADRSVGRHIVHTARIDGGRRVARGLLGTALRRLDVPFEGTIEVRWSRCRHQQVEVLTVRVGQEPLRAQDMWRRLAEAYRKANEQQTGAMVDMFGASSSVIRAAGDVGNAVAGHPPSPPSPDPSSSSWSELLRHAEAAGVHDFVRQFLEGATQAEQAQSSCSPPVDCDDGLVEPEAELFDAWSFVGVDVGEE